MDKYSKISGMATSREFSTLQRLLLNRADGFLRRRQSRKIHSGVLSSTPEENISNDSERRFENSRFRMTKEIIEANTEITKNHLTPEMRLRLLTPNCRLYDAPVVDDVVENNFDPSSVKNLEKRIFRDPFWSIYWPGGQALTRFVLDRGCELLNESKKNTTTFLDLGCGCGASAIAAKIMGATRVTANDIDEVACIAAQLNASLNNVDIEVTSENLLENVDGGYESVWDVILVGDLLYDEETAEILIPWLEKVSLRNGSRIYLGDPGRQALTEALKTRMELRTTYSLPDNVRTENYGYDTASVWQFKKPFPSRR